MSTSRLNCLIALSIFAAASFCRAAEPDAAQAIAALKAVGAKLDGGGKDPAKTVHRVDLAGTKAADADLVHLKALPNLQSLNLSKCPISDAGLENVKGLARLTRLDLLDCPITDAGMKHLQGLSRLTFLNLRGTKITSAGLAYCKDMTGLQSLHLNLTKVGGGLVHIKDLANLTQLNLGATDIGDADLEQLRGLTKLNALILYSFKGKVTDAGLAHIKGLPELRTLDLRMQPVTDRGLEHLAALTKLSFLDLTGSRVTDMGLKHLSPLANLHGLRLRGPGFTDAAVPELQKLTGLQVLELNGTRVTEEGKAKLRQALPRLRVVASKEEFIAADRGGRRSPRRVLLVSHAGGFMHDSLLTAEQVLKELGPKYGLEITCYRFTADPDARVKVKRRVDGKDVETQTTALEEYSERFRRINGEPVDRKQCGRVNARSLRGFDAVIFFTTSTWYADRGSHPLTAEELKDLLGWVRDGGAFVGVHCASDTLHNTAFSDLVGATFGGHPWVQKVRLRAEDPKHPAARGLTDGAELHDEIYQFGAKPSDARIPLRAQPFSRERLHIILSVDPRSIDTSKGSRPDHDYAVSWCQHFGKGRSFYTALGHHREVWKDTRFQEHLLGGLRWALGQLEGDATPGPKPKSAQPGG